MNNRQLVKIFGFSILGLLTVWLTMAAVYPLLEHVLRIEAVQPKEAEATPVPEPEREPEELLVTAIYQREAGAKDIDAIHIEVFHTGTGKAYYMEVPVHTKVTLSTELFKKLQAYSPELPQYFKLSKMGEDFSEEYCLTACNRILSEVLGVTIEHYVCTSAEGAEAWSSGIKKQMTVKNPDREFYLQYAKWVENTESDLTALERWVYYESYQKLRPAQAEPAPGAEGLSEYIISTKQAESRLQEFMRLVEE